MVGDPECAGAEPERRLPLRPHLRRRRRLLGLGRHDRRQRRRVGLLLQHWDGSTWTDMSASVPDSSTPGMLSSLSCVSSVQCWVVGSLGTFGGGGGGNFRPQSIIENWNGTSWSIEPSPDVAALSFLDSVSCVRSVGVPRGRQRRHLHREQQRPGTPVPRRAADVPPGFEPGHRPGGPGRGSVHLRNGSVRRVDGGRVSNAPVVGIAATPDGGGYWLVASDGGVFNFGDARFYGSMGGQHLNSPVVGIAATPDGRATGWSPPTAASSTSGTPSSAGSMGGQHLNAPVVGMAADDAGGYWLVASDGGVFNFGDAPFIGSMGGQHLNAPVAGIAGTPDGGGYWLVGSDGGIFNYGDAPASSAPCRVRASSASRRWSASAGRRVGRGTGSWVRTAPCTPTATPRSWGRRAGCVSRRRSRASPPRSGGVRRSPSRRRR